MRSQFALWVVVMLLCVFGVGLAFAFVGWLLGVPESLSFIPALIGGALGLIFANRAVKLPY